MALSFEQTLLVGFLGGAGSGIIITCLKYFLQERQNKQQKQQYLYGKLLGLKESICNYSLYNNIARINFYYNGWWERLSIGKAEEFSSQERKTWQQTIKETEFDRSNKFSELFETLGLIWTVFPKDAKLDNHIKSCFKIVPVPIKHPIEIGSKADIQKWRNEEEKRIYKVIKEQINNPLNLVIKYIHNKIVNKK